MGYNTYFDGLFKTDRPLDDESVAEEFRLKFGDDGWELTEQQKVYTEGGKMYSFRENIFDMAVWFYAKGFVLSGKMTYSGENFGDLGIIELDEDQMTIHELDLDRRCFVTTVNRFLE